MGCGPLVRTYSSGPRLNPTSINYRDARRHQCPRRGEVRFHRFAYDELLACDKVNLNITWLQENGDIFEQLTAAAAELAQAMTPVHPDSDASGLSRG